MRDEEGSFDVAPVGVRPLRIENALENFHVGLVDGIFECDGDHHGDVLDRYFSRRLDARRGAEALGQLAHVDGHVIAGGRAVGVSLGRAAEGLGLVGPVGALLRPVAEGRLGDAESVGAGQTLPFLSVVLANRFRSVRKK